MARKVSRFSRKEFAQFGICLNQVVGVFTDLPGKDDLRLDCLNYLPDASCPRVWGSLHSYLSFLLSTVFCASSANC